MGTRGDGQRARQTDRQLWSTVRMQLQTHHDLIVLRGTSCFLTAASRVAQLLRLLCRSDDATAPYLCPRHPIFEIIKFSLFFVYFLLEAFQLIDAAVQSLNVYCNVGTGITLNYRPHLHAHTQTLILWKKLWPIIAMVLLTV